MNRRTWTDEELVDAVKVCESISSVLRYIGLNQAGGNQASIKKHIARLGLNYSHFTRGSCLRALRRNHIKSLVPIDCLLIKDSITSSSHIARRLRRANLLKEICADCGNEGNHNGKSLQLQLDHINGDSTNNTLENLRWLCPNCHSQTPTFAGRSSNFRNTRRKELERERISALHVEVKPKRPRKFKIAWPTIEVLQEMVKHMPLLKIASQLGVSDKAVKKHCNRNGVETYPRGYWAKQKSYQ